MKKQIFTNHYNMFRNRRLITKKKIFKVTFVLLLLFGLLYFFYYAGKFLVYTEPPQHSDVIIVLAGDSGVRMAKGVDLYHQGYASKMITSGGVIYNRFTAAELMRDHAVQLGVPLQAVILETRADSTYTNATYTLDLLKQHNFTSAIVVTSNYHMFRTKNIFDRVYAGNRIKLTYCAAQDPMFNPKYWWSKNKSLLATVTEYLKLAGFLIGRRN